MLDSSFSFLSHLDEKARVLVVDDTSTNRFVLSKLLKREGYSVYTAEDGSTAIKLAQLHQPTVILLDIMMPDMDGYEVCRQLRSDPTTAAIPIIFLSALDAAFDKVQAFQKGAADYVTKPFQAEEVLARVRHQINLQVAYQKQQQLNEELENRVKERTQLLELAHDQLLEVALTDRLTRLPNRLSFVKRLSKVMARSQLSTEPVRSQAEKSLSQKQLSHKQLTEKQLTEKQLIKESQANSPAAAKDVEGVTSDKSDRLPQQFAVIFLDCDRFKRINDSLGHRVGDQLLKGVARRLTLIQQEHPEVDTVARFGGDEFALLLSRVPGKAAVVDVAEQILQSLSLPFSLAGREIFINASIGLVWGEPSYVAAEHLLRDADVAMYRAKGCSRSQYRWFESAMHNRAVHLLQLETDLRLALERREFELHYQPIVELEQMTIVGFEALVRWHHPTKGLIPPNDFIPFAEESNFIIPLGELLLNMACEDIARWEAAGLLTPELSVSVNVAAQQLLQPDILDRIQGAIAANGIEPHRLRLELTERSILKNHTFIDEVLRTLQRQNIQLSIDDFGTGYSALSYLHTLPVNCLKVDRSFVQPITTEPDSLGIVPLIINIAKTMNMQVIAEGIENMTQLQQLRKLGCEYGQGHLFQQAVPADAAIALLAHPLEHRNGWQDEGSWLTEDYLEDYSEDRPENYSEERWPQDDWTKAASA